MSVCLEGSSVWAVLVCTWAARAPVTGCGGLARPVNRMRGPGRVPHATAGVWAGELCWWRARWVPAKGEVGADAVRASHGRWQPPGRALPVAAVGSPAARCWHFNLWNYTLDQPKTTARRVNISRHSWPGVSLPLRPGEHGDSVAMASSELSLPRPSPGVPHP